MQRGFRTDFCLACTVLVVWLAVATSAGARVFLIGLDGASWNVIDPMLERGELPTLAAWVTRGRTAELETVEPVSSPVVWTSIATGRRPEAHGITDFYGTRLRMQVPSAFERLARRGIRVGLYDYLVTWPPVELPGGFVIPGWLRRDPSVSPADVWARAGVDPFVVDYDVLKTDAQYLDMSRQELAHKASRWKALVRSFDPQVGVVTFYTPDMRSHRFWRAAFPEEFDAGGPPPPEELRTAISDGYRGVDRALGQIHETLREDDVLLVASDHGFHAGEEVRPVWVTSLAPALAGAGLDPGRDRFSLISEFFAPSLRVHPGPDFAERDAVAERLVALLKSCRTEVGQPLFAVYRVDVAERPPGMERSLLERIYQWGIRQALWYVFSTRLDPDAHAVVFGMPEGDTLEALWPDGKVRVGERTVPLSDLVARQEFSGTHDPIGVFLASGGPIAASAERGRISVLDVAPLLFYLAGQPIPDDLEGELPRDWIHPEVLAARPPETIAASEIPGFVVDGAPAAGVDPDLTEKLRALGYVE
ncbi:MAG: alkaline phosphatase family protein [Myxococcota bacterium]